MQDGAELEQLIPDPAPIHRERPTGIRVLAPTGDLGYVPEDQVEAVVAAGGKVISSGDMKEIRQAIFMEHMLFKDRNARRPKPRKRRSIVRGGRR